MLADEIKARMFHAMKAHRIVEKEILRVALGEIQTAGSRLDRPINEEEVVAILRKLVKSNEESLTMCDDAERSAALREENSILETLLPKTLGVEDVVAALAGQLAPLRAANAEGQAIGIAMKHLKQAGISAPGDVVKLAVQRLRA